MPRSPDNRYLDNFGIPKDHPIWQHLETEARLAGRTSVKRYVLDLLLDRDAQLWGHGQSNPPQVGPQHLWFPGNTALLDLASIEALQTLLSNVTGVPNSTASETLTFDEDTATAFAAAFADAWSDDE
jgi:hypothetical protein